MGLFEIFLFSIIAGIAVISFSMQLNAPFREFPFIGIAAFVTQFVYMVGYYHLYSILYATLLSSICLTLVSRILAYNRRIPITIFLIPGFWPIAPGAVVYKATLCFINNNLLSAQEFILLSIQMAGAIVIGVSFVYVIPQKFFNVNIKFLQWNRNGQFYE